MSESSKESIALGKQIRNKMLLTSLLCAVPGVLTLAIKEPSLRMWLTTVPLGYLYANFFEYIYHRWVLHLGKGFLFWRHVNHHETAYTEHAAEHNTFGDKPPLVVALFAINTIPAYFLFGLPVAAVLLVTFISYFLLLEAIHWHIHENGVSGDIGYEHHWRHHDMERGNYNVYLPIFDYLLGTKL